jgi:hypothetical protein
MKTIPVPEQFLKDLHNCSCMPDVKKALEKNFGEVFAKKSIEASKGMIILHGKIPYIISEPCNFVMTNLTDGWSWDREKPQDNLSADLNYYDFRPMRSGTITMTVKDGKVAGATVQED